jgi:BirA family biotin operon repressor/biotin-[acetyl-CoA-carboxylase] ligase
MSGGQHLHWGAEALWQRLGPQLPGLSVEVVAQVESTNTALIERARRSGGLRDAPISQPGEFDPTDDPRTPHGRRSGDTQPCLLVAEHQTRGRGRQGRAWQSAPGASLTFSLALPFAPANWSGLSLAVGVALADALDPLGEGGAALIGLKWPNDLWLTGAGDPGRKLGGVLIETLPVGDRRMCIVGIGLNVLPQQFEDLSSGYACWQEIDPHATAPSVLAAAVEPLVRALRRFEREGFAAFAGVFRNATRCAAVRSPPPNPGCLSGPTAPTPAARWVRVDGVVHARGRRGQRAPAGSGTTTC